MQQVDEQKLMQGQKGRDAKRYLGYAEEDVLEKWMKTKWNSIQRAKQEKKFVLDRQVPAPSN